MITGLLTSDEGSSSHAIKICDNCREHEGQYLMNPTELEAGSFACGHSEELWYCTECWKAANNG